MKVTVIGAGNSGLAMAAHLSNTGNEVTLWNRSESTISKLLKTNVIKCEGVIDDEVTIDVITNDIKLALKDPDVIFITTPANSHKELAELIGKNIETSSIIVLCPGRTFGALEFQQTYHEFNTHVEQTIAETQTIIYTCRKIDEETVNIISLKNDVLISTFDASQNQLLIESLPQSLQEFFIPAKSMIYTSIGNVGMILHCAPLLLNVGWTESDTNYRHYFDGITPTVGRLLEKIDYERITIARALGEELETTKEWLERTYEITGNNLYETIQNNEAYNTIDSPSSLQHRYIWEDVPCGLVPLEAMGLRLGIDMKYTTLIIDLANALLDFDFRENGRTLSHLGEVVEEVHLESLFERKNNS